MRILHVATLVSPEGAYGGPVRVAINQTSALADLGHSVLLLAGTRGYAVPPERESNVSLRLFPAHFAIARAGFAALFSIKLLLWAWRHLSEFDVVHVHLGRDLITLPVAWLATRLRIPLVVQTHGMVAAASRNPLSRPIDAALTRRTLRRARACLYLNELEAIELRRVANADINLTEMPNGVPKPREPRNEPPNLEVLFLARLHPRKRPAAFVLAANALRRSYPHARFRLVGPDEGEARNVESTISRLEAGDAVAYEGPCTPEDTNERFERASLYVLPSINEPYPMSVLEAMSVGLPVIVTETCGLAGSIRQAEAGLVVDERQETLREAMDKLMGDPEARRRMGSNGREWVSRNGSIEAIAKRLVACYKPDSMQP